MASQKSIEKINELKQKITKAKSVIFAEYHGLDANKVNELRAQIKETGAEMTVAKNTLMKIALEEAETGSKELNEQLDGPIATFFAYEDAISPIKALAEFAEKFEFPTIKAGIIAGEFTSAEKMNILGKLPSKEELLTRIVRGFSSPLTGFANVLGGGQRKIVYALSAIADKRAESGS